MKIAPIPENEEFRINELKKYKILDTDKEKEYDDLVELASQICNCPTALITFIDSDRQWIKAKKHFNVTETSRDEAFCSHTILQNNVMVVADAKTDDRFYDNPFVIGDPHIGFYAGAPIVSSNGHNLGSVCVIDNFKKNDLTDNQKKALTIIANQVSKLLEFRTKNELLITYADTQIKAEKRIAQLIIAENNKKDNEIAIELHENVAQTLATIKLFLDSAIEPNELQTYFLQKSKEGIGLIIEQIRELSKSISPTTIQNADLYWFIYDYAIHFGKRNNINVTINEAVVLDIKDIDLSLNLYKVVQKQLAISKLLGATEISIVINVGDNINLNFIDNANSKAVDIFSIQLLHKITARVELMKGSYSQKIDKEQNCYTIVIPTHISF